MGKGWCFQRIFGHFWRQRQFWLSLEGRLGHFEGRGQDIANSPTTHRTVPTANNYLKPNANNVKVENSDIKKTKNHT